MTPGERRERPIVPLGSDVPPYGTVGAVLWLGERYYHLVDKHGDVAMMPADVIEALFERKEGDTK